MPRLLRLVGQGQGTDPPKRRRGVPSPALMLTDTEARAVRAAIANVARTFGSKRKLAAALGVDAGSLSKTTHRPGPALAIALARVSGMSVDAVLGWKALTAVPGGAP